MHLQDHTIGCRSCHTARRGVALACHWSHTTGCTHVNLLSEALDTRASGGGARAPTGDSCGVRVPASSAGPRRLARIGSIYHAAHAACCPLRWCPRRLVCRRLNTWGGSVLPGRAREAHLDEGARQEEAVRQADLSAAQRGGHTSAVRRQVGKVARHLPWWSKTHRPRSTLSAWWVAEGGRWSTRRSNS